MFQAPQLAALVAVLPIVAIVSLTAASQATNLVVSEQDNGKTVTATVQQPFSVQLRSNASTGYTWVLAATNGTSVSITGPSVYTSVPGGGVGAGGTQTFPLLATKAGDTTLAFDYLKPWDPSSVAQTFTVTIAVAEPIAGPKLAIERRGTTVIISWPVPGSEGFYLEGTRTIAADWAALNALPISDGTRFTVSLSSSGSLLFFRLRQ